MDRSKSQLPSANYFHTCYFYFYVLFKAHYFFLLNSAEYYYYYYCPLCYGSLRGDINSVIFFAQIIMNK